MANRLKEDEKNERIIRNLLKLPENRRCINCNSLGPQYVCTNFSTFICTSCSGIHREFTHRVKSVSMAKFTPQEVSALQGGGNASAREIYLKEWDTQRNSLPDGSNVERLRDFIKHVYVDRRYTGERNLEKPLREKMGETEDNRRMDAYQGGRSPPYEDRSGDRPSTGGRSPGYDQENPRYSGYKSPARAEVVNDWRREDRFTNGRRSEDRSSDGGSKVEGRSPDRQRDSDMPSPPIVRPVREILGENVTPLRVIEPPKANAGKSTDGSAHSQIIASSSGLASADVNPPQTKVEASFIDFDSVPEPPVTAISSQAQMAANASATNPQTSSNNWANFDAVPPTSSSLESLLSDLSISAPAPTQSGPSPAVASPLFDSGCSQGSSSGPSFGAVTQLSVIPTDGAPASYGEGNLVANASAGGQWAALSSQQHSLFPGGSGQHVPRPVAPATAGASNNMPWNPLIAPNIHGPPAAANAQTGQSGNRPSINNTGFSMEPSVNTQPGGRKELPADLFSMSYSNFPPQASGWYSGAPYFPGVHMQYNMPVVAPNFQQASRSTNPFDVGNEPSSIQQSTFPLVASMQGALPKMVPSSGLLRTSSLGTIPSHTTPPKFPQLPSYAPAVPPSSYLGQDTGGSMMARPPQGQSGFNLADPTFTSLNSNHQIGSLHPAHSAPNLPSMGGNPFG